MSFQVSKVYGEHHTYKDTHTHTHTYIYIYMYVYMDIYPAKNVLFHQLIKLCFEYRIAWKWIINLSNNYDINKQM